MIELQVNGDTLGFHGRTVADLLRQLEIHGRRLAVEVNLEIVPRSEHGEHELHDGDTVEIVHAIGGG